MIELEDVRLSLQGCFGTALAHDPGFTEGAVQLLQAWYPQKESLNALSRRMEEYLFGALYERLGPAMTFLADDGTSRRVQLSDLPTVAEIVLYRLYVSLRHDAGCYALLHDHWLASGSFPAMRALYVCFLDFLPSAEKDWIERIVRENVPANLQDAWFQGKD